MEKYGEIVEMIENVKACRIGKFNRVRDQGRRTSKTYRLYKVKQYR